MNQLIERFFQRFERANASSDLATICSLYADTFMFGGANGVKVVKKEDFLSILPRMKAHFASLGLSDAQLASVQGSAINGKYVLAKVAWRMNLRELTGDRKGIDAFATYVLQKKEDDTFSIVLQIDHQDLAKVFEAKSASSSI